ARPSAWRTSSRGRTSRRCCRRRTPPPASAPGPTSPHGGAAVLAGKLGARALATSNCEHTAATMTTSETHCAKKKARIIAKLLLPSPTQHSSQVLVFVVVFSFFRYSTF
ncbi:unnamed protein product, partial [Heterosigma akashiwo]